MKKYLTMDVGGSSIKYAVIDEDLNILVKGKEPVGTHSKEELFDPIKKIADAYKEGVEGLAMSIPGMLDQDNGFAVTGGAFSWIKNMEYAKEVSELTGLKTTICNDAKAAAMAEIGYGNLQGISDGIVIILGSGIGGAVVVNNELLLGKRYLAGEFSVLMGDVRQRNGNDDMFALTNGITGVRNVMKKYTGLDDIEGLEAFRLIKANDENAIAAMREFCDILVRFIFNINIVIDADRCVIGGGISNEPMLMDFIHEAATQERMGVFAGFMPEITECKFKADSNLIGALYHYRQLNG